MKKTLILSVLCLSCASQPKLYPNQKYKSVGKEAAKADIDLCQQEASAFLESEKGKQITKGAASGAVVGGVMGAAVGLFTGNVGRGAVRGGVIGGATGAAGGAVQPETLKRRYVNRCLAEKGYEVLGWD